MPPSVHEPLKTGDPGPRTELLEREHELSVLAEVISGSCAGQGAVVIVEGPAGAGKSSLLRAAERIAEAGDLAIVTGRGSELETALPFGVARQLMPAVDLRSEALEAAADRERHAALLTRFQDELSGAVLGDGGPAELTPHLVIVDDAQWADPPSLAYLAHLALRAGTLPVAVVVGVRTGDGPLPAELELLRRGEAVRTIVPQRLSAAAVRALTRRSWGAEPDDELVAACLATTGGNPFYLCELVRDLSELQRVPTAAEVSSAAPPSVLRALLARLAALGDAPARLAIALAVLGDRVPLAWAAELAQLRSEQAEEAADTLAEAELATAGEPVALAHPLIGAALRSDMGAFALARAHRDAATVLRRAGAPPERVATHLLNARPSDDREAVNTLRAAASTARDHGDPAAAARLLTRALRESPAKDDRAGLLTELARAEAAVGDPAATGHLEEALALLDDPHARAEAVADLAQLVQWAGDFEKATALAQRGAAELAPDDPSARRLRAVGLGAALLSPATNAAASGELEAVMREAAAGRPPAEPGLLALLATYLTYGGGDAQLATSVARAAFAADPLVDEGSQGMSLAFAGVALVDLDIPSVSTPLIEAAVATARERGAVLTGSVAHHLHALLDLRRGELASALVHAEQSLGVYRDGWVEIPWAAPALVCVHVERGDLDAAAHTVAAYDQPDLAGIARARMLEAGALLALARGEAADALGAATEAIRLTKAASPGPRLPVRGFDAMQLAARAAHRVGDHAQARALLDELTEPLRHVHAPRALGLTLAARAELDDTGDAPALLLEALEALQAAGATLAALHVRADLAVALREAGQGALAREHLSLAYEHAERVGARPLADRARTQLWALGVRPRRAARSGVQSLTPSEQRVAMLAADGLSTPQIAHELFVTRKTVESHLSRIYRKLDIRGRGELPAHLAKS